MTVPSLLDALVHISSSVLNASADKLIRVENLVGQDPRTFIHKLDEKNQFRIGLTGRHKKIAIGRTKGVSSSPAEITRWRNEIPKKRSQSPIIILGDASGREEAGLRKTPIVIGEHDILDAWRARVIDELNTYEARQPRAFASALIDMTTQGLLDAATLSEFICNHFRSAKAAVLEPQQNLWKLGLLPDPRAMDFATPGGRLSLNYTITQFLGSAADTMRDVQQLKRIESKAESGDTVAKKVVQYRQSLDYRDLRGLDLDSVLDLLKKPKDDGGPDGKSDYFDLFEALDDTLVDANVIESLGKQINLEAKEEIELTQFVGKDRIIKIDLIKDSNFVFGNGTISNQVIFTKRGKGTALDHAEKCAATDLETLASIGDEIIGVSKYRPLVDTLLEVREKLLPLCHWGDGLLIMLFVKSEFRDLANSYMNAWTALVEEIIREKDPVQVSQLASTLRQLDAHWELDEGGSIEAVDLLPIHPFVLRPTIDLAKYGADNLGESSLGTKLSWAFGRIMPAYPALWQGELSLVLSDAGLRPRYHRRAEGSLPPIATPGGIAHLFKTYLGMHPYATDHLSLLLVDPPKGGGISKAIDSAIGGKRRLRDITVYIVTTKKDEALFSALNYQIEHLGLHRNLESFLKKTPLRFNLAIQFVRPEAAGLGTHTGQMRPSRGLHNSISVSASQSPLRNKPIDELILVPSVSVQPREANDVVRLFMQMARENAQADKWYEVTPVLNPDRERGIFELSKVCDWMVLATPSPIGLVPPRKFTNSPLAYLGREAAEAYGLSVYSDDLFSIRRRIQDRLTKAPMAPDVVAIEEQIRLHADATPNGVLSLGLGQITLVAQLGLITAAQYAQNFFSRDDYLIVMLSVDSLEWTQHWLGERRCDLLCIGIAVRPEVSPKIRIIAVESKARGGTEEIRPEKSAPDFEGAIEQIVQTLDALQEILLPSKSEGFFADLKQGVFVEHLLSEVLAKISPIRPAESWKREVLRLLTALSRREILETKDIELSGVVVLTQTEASVQNKTNEISEMGADGTSWKIKLIRCGIPELHRLFGPVASPPLGGPSRPVETGAEPSSREPMVSPPITETGSPDKEIEKGEASKLAMPEDLIDLIAQLETACRLREFKIEPIDASLLKVGPTLVTVPVVLEAGESIKPIETALPDIARELGVKALSVENDPRPYHVRFLIPSRHRIYPPIPKNSLIPFDLARKSYLGMLLGQTVDGQDFRTFVSDWPHLLMAGTTGSGKTTLMKSILTQINQAPDGFTNAIVVDGKGEFDYVGLLKPTLFKKPFTDVLLGHEHVVKVLDWLIKEEIVSRRDLLRAYFEKNPKASRQPREAFVSAMAQGADFPIHPLLVVIDEFAEIMLAAGSAAHDFEDLVQRVVQIGRSTMVHLLLATQRPDANVIKGSIKANIPSRIALSLPSHHDSMTVLNSPGAEDLLGNGDMLFYSSTGARDRLQGYNPITTEASA